MARHHMLEPKEVRRMIGRNLGSLVAEAQTWRQIRSLLAAGDVP